MLLLSRLLTVLLAIGLSGLAPSANAATPAKAGTGRTAVAKNRIVIQVNEEDGKKWMAVLANIRNIQAELGKANASIAVVAIGGGLGILTADSVAANDVQDALSAGVEFVACGNSMHAQKVEQDELIEGVKVAKAGYVEIMRRQQQGWTYLRP